jgi:hypothetical protein
MTHSSDLDRMRARARLLARFFAFALATLAHPGLARLRRALTRLEDQFREWLIGMIYRAPEGFFGAPARATIPAQPPTLSPPRTKIKPLASRFRLGIAPLREGSDARIARRSAALKPETDQLAAMNARLIALIRALDDPSRPLNRLARILARRPLVIMASRPIVSEPSPKPATPAPALKAPEPHKRE